MPVATSTKAQTSTPPINIINDKIIVITIETFRSVPNIFSKLFNLLKSLFLMFPPHYR